MSQSTDIKQLFIAVNEALSDVVSQADASQLDKELTAVTAYEEGQTLKSYINILAYENDCVPKVLNGEKDFVLNADFEGDLLEGDVASSFKRLTDQANQAVTDCDLEKTVHISYGDFPASGYLTDITIQRAYAILDVADFTGATINMTDDVIDGVIAITAPYADTLREYGVFPPEVTVADDASKLDKLRGLGGRQPAA